VAKSIANVPGAGSYFFAASRRPPACGWMCTAEQHRGQSGATPKENARNIKRLISSSATPPNLLCRRPLSCNSSGRPRIRLPLAWAPTRQALLPTSFFNTHILVNPREFTLETQSCLESIARHGFRLGPTRPSGFQPVSGEPTRYFPVPLRLTFCGVAKALSLIVISPVSKPVLCGWN
jgi:hypothetical protein